MDSFELNRCLLEFVTTQSDMTSSNFNSLNESQKIDLSDKLMDKVFETMMPKYVKIDFGTIPSSAGDITKFNHYANMLKCIDQLVELNAVTHKIEDITDVKTALNNMIALKSQFMYSFKKDNSYGIILYNCMTLAIFDMTTLFITNCIKFINAKDDVTEVSITDNYNRECVLLKNIRLFNDNVKTGNIQKYLSTVTEIEPMNESVVGAVLVASKIAAGAGLVYIVARIIPSMIKQLIFYWYNAKQKISDGARRQADLLSANIEVLSTDDGNSKIITKQTKIAKMFNAVADKFDLQTSRADAQTKKDLVKDTVSADDLAF